MIHPIGLLSFVVLGALSTTVSRPFDRNRDGQNCAVVVGAP